MPRGFLVKRNKKSVSVSYRSRCSDEDQDDAFIENDMLEGYTKPFNSPDSGYGHSPVTLLIKESPAFRFDRDSVYSPVSSPHSTTYSYPSPLTYTTSSSSSSSSPSSSLNVERDKTLWPFTVTPTTPTRRLPSGIPPPLRIKRPLTEDTERKQHRAKKPKAARKLNFDDDNTSPVHGTIIRGDVTSDGGHHNGKGVNGGCDGDKGGVDNSLGGDFVCQLCKEQYPDPFSLAQHKCSRIVHVEYRCPECDKVFNCPANLASHRRWHKPRPNSRSSLNSPRILPASPAKPDGSKTFEVTHQTEQTDGSLTLIKDDLTSTGSDSSRSTPSPGQATPNEEGQYECEQCGKKFRRPANLRKHMQHHGEEETYPCQYCGQMFSSLTSRAKHVLSHAVGPKEVNCDVCGGSYQNKMALEQHVRLHHSNEVYPCKYCSSNFTSSPGLTRHINKRHPSENRQVILLQQLPVQP